MLAKCRQPSFIGDSCDPDVAHSCEYGAYCNEKSRKCRKQGDLGSRCEPSVYIHKQCADSTGLYCKRTKQDETTGTSERKLCFGFRIEVGEDERTLCMPRRLEGQLCTNNFQCRGETRVGSTRSDTVCYWVDKHMGVLPLHGVCAKERDLIRTAGAPRTSALDLCDARRDLRCEKREGKNVCGQNGGFNLHAHTQCTPDSKFSKCPGQVCRQFTK